MSNNKSKISSPHLKVVKSPKRHNPINFEDYLFIRKDSPHFTALTEAQQEAIRKIENYWINRTRNYKHWKSQKHWSYKKESISARIEEGLFNKIKNRNNSRIIQDFIRQFLIDDNFREEFQKKIDTQYQLDQYPILEFYKSLDPTDKKTLLINLFPKVISGEIHVLEKELFVFYFTFLNDFSISYVIRVALIHYNNFTRHYFPIRKEQVIDILTKLMWRFHEVE